MFSLRTTAQGRGLPISVRELASGLNMAGTISLAEVIGGFLIDQKYHETGGVMGPLGSPVSDLRLLATGNYQRDYRGGDVQVARGKNPSAVTRRQTTIRYKGLKCVKETSETSPSDEPYVFISLYAPSRRADATTKKFPGGDSAYGKVDEGEERAEIEDLWTQRPPNRLLKNSPTAMTAPRNGPRRMLEPG